MEFNIEDQGVEHMHQSIQDVLEGVKYLQLLRSHVMLSFDKEIVQVVTETRSVLYDLLLKLIEDKRSIKSKKSSWQDISLSKYILSK
jgi:hypothetical protein